jgi:heme A synthase
MKDVHLVVGIGAIALNSLVALLGAWRWWRTEQSGAFWPLLRVAQGVLVLQAVLGGVLVLLGHKPSGLHALYGLLPLLVSFLGEQLRLASAAMVLDARGFESSAALRRLPEDEQRLVALSIVQREMGVMTIAALVIVVLLVRAAGTAG